MVDQIRNIIAAGERTERDIFFQGAADLLDRVSMMQRHGYNDGLPNGIWRTLWPNNFNYPRILTAGQIEVVSTSPDDDFIGTGARRILMSGCDAEGNPLYDIVEMNGLLPVTTSKEFFWMDFAHVIQSGSSYGGAQGDITLTHQGVAMTGDDMTVGKIDPDYNRTQQAVAVIPNEYSGYILDHVVTAPVSRTLKYGFRVSSWPDDDDRSVRQIAFSHIGEGGGPSWIGGKSSERIHYPALVEMVAQSTSGTAPASGQFSLMVVHDDYDFTIPDDFFYGDASEQGAVYSIRPGIAMSPGSFNWPNKKP